MSVKRKKRRSKKRNPKKLSGAAAVAHAAKAQRRKGRRRHKKTNPGHPKKRHHKRHAGAHNPAHKKHRRSHKRNPSMGPMVSEGLKSLGSQLAGLAAGSGIRIGAVMISGSLSNGPSTSTALKVLGVLGGVIGAALAHKWPLLGQSIGQASTDAAFQNTVASKIETLLAPSPDAAARLQGYKMLEAGISAVTSDNQGGRRMAAVASDNMGAVASDNMGRATVLRPPF